MTIHIINTYTLHHDHSKLQFTNKKKKSERARHNEEDVDFAIRIN